MKEKIPLSKEELLLGLQESYYTLEHNFVLLLKAQTEYMKDQSLCHLIDMAKYRIFMRNFSRLLHNYLASFYSLFEHAKAISNNVTTVGFERDYKKKKEVFNAEEVNAFVRDLRNFAQHKKLPPVGTGVDLMFTHDGVVANEPCGFIRYLPSLRIEDLITYKKWSAASKKFLKRQPKEMEIMPFVNEANKNTTDFFMWLYAKIKNW